MQKQYLSPERFAELTQELDSLKTVKRIEVAQRLKQAKEYGDLSENSEYAEAREEQANVEGRIFELEELMKNVEVIAPHHGGTTIEVGSTIVVRKGEKTATYMIVGSYEANPVEGKISDESPLGKAFLGKKIGDHVSVVTPGGTMKYEILKIQ